MPSFISNDGQSSNDDISEAKNDLRKLFIWWGKIASAFDSGGGRIGYRFRNANIEGVGSYPVYTNETKVITICSCV